MNILFLSNKVPYPPKDGGSIASFGMIKAFADAGHKTTVMAMNTRKHHVTPFEIPAEIQAQITLHMVEVPALIKLGDLIKNLLFSNLPYNAERFINTVFQKKLADLLATTEFDIIQLEGLYLCPYIPTIRKFSAAKIAYRSHNIEHEIWERTVIQSKGIKKIYLKHLTKRLKEFEINELNQYDLLVPITDRDRLKLDELGNTKPTLTIPAGFSFEKTESAPEDFILNLFFIGALDWSPNQEGLDWFLQYCWPEILLKKPDTRLVIAGRNAPNWMVDRLKSNRNIDFLGEINNAREYIRKNGVMIAPLLSGSGMRVKIVEGMLYHKAIVTTSIGCEGIEVQNKEQLFIADTANDFAKHCLILLQNKKKVVATGDKAFKFAQEHYDNRLLNQKLVAFYMQHL